ncbi:serine hydrolase domain-containing protein [Paenibacillus tyrfis]|uniref:serine hydrolase domain-containing protein n=1 Tax=Paenibacillus tyrfis TaxID=1501230 RepID=UPI00209CFE96|nr:serine hydrolase domain-containing protein [Paenibacillus tyrfis]MCP1309811.1 beta-lactamase family protein [Paenibacillus tyrfis]
MNKQRAQLRMEEHFRKVVRNDRKIQNAYLLVHSEKLGIHLNIAEGSTGNRPAHAGQRYFIASVSKLFTSVLTVLLVQEGKVSYEDPIQRYVDTDLLHGLHVVKGKDYTGEIRIKHLLGHTSGLHDYFEDKPKQGKAMMELILEEPSRFWTPQEVIQWSRENLPSHFPPGQGFHYSDTGYHLLGLMIETVTSLPLHQALRHYIFQPLGMKHSHLAHHGEPIAESEHPIADLYIDNIRVTDYSSLSVEYAGGGIVSASEDLLTFVKALANHELLRKDSFESMKVWSKFAIGIDYGYGLVSFRTVPLVMPKKYNMWGNFGSTGSFMFYHPASELYLIGSLNRFGSYGKAIRLMLKCIDIAAKG